MLSSTSLSASNSSVQRLRPFGGWLQARAIKRASFSPSRIGSMGGRSRFFRSRAASSPWSTKRLRMLSTVRLWHENAWPIASSPQQGPSLRRPSSECERVGSGRPVSGLCLPDPASPAAHRNSDGRCTSCWACRSSSQSERIGEITNIRHACFKCQ